MNTLTRSKAKTIKEDYIQRAQGLSLEDIRASLYRSTNSEVCTKQPAKTIEAFSISFEQKSGVGPAIFSNSPRRNSS